MTDILDPNPFANPLKAHKGNANARDIYTAVGYALHRWENCEIGFAMIYSALTLPTGGNHVLMRAYGVISGASTRREMIQAACDAYFLLHPHDELMAETRHLLNLYGHASSRRNEIAHAVVSATLRSRTVNKVAVPLPREWFLGPPIFATRKNDKLSFETNGTIVTGPKYRYSTVEIDHFSKCFAELEVRAANLSQRIRAFHASLPQKSD